jgi:hypothetical protein
VAFLSHGAQGRNRTTDTVIFSHVLYQLSYLGAGSPPRSRDMSAGPYRGSVTFCPERLRQNGGNRTVAKTRPRRAQPLAGVLQDRAMAHKRRPNLPLLIPAPGPYPPILMTEGTDDGNFRSSVTQMGGRRGSYLLRLIFIAAVPRGLADAPHHHRLRRRAPHRRPTASGAGRRRRSGENKTDENARPAACRRWGRVSSG